MVGIICTDGVYYEMTCRYWGQIVYKRIMSLIPVFMRPLSGFLLSFLWGFGLFTSENMEFEG